MESYQAWKHQVRVSSTSGRWAVAVDETALPGWFVTPADAWAAGVREADRREAECSEAGRVATGVR
jgi:hypothetical protein